MVYICLEWNFLNLTENALDVCNALTVKMFCWHFIAFGGCMSEEPMGKPCLHSA